MNYETSSDEELDTIEMGRLTTDTLGDAVLLAHDAADASAAADSDADADADADTLPMPMTAEPAALAPGELPAPIAADAPLAGVRPSEARRRTRGPLGLCERCGERSAVARVKGKETGGCDTRTPS